MAKSNTSISTLPASLLLKLGQAYNSMSDLDLPLFTILKDIQEIIQCENVSIWLLNGAGTELECTHVVGSQAGKLLGDVIRAKKFSSCFRINADEKIDLDTVPYKKWLDSRSHLSHLKLGPEQLAISLLKARNKLIGALIATNKVRQPAFTRIDKDILHTTGTDIAIAIQNTQLYELQDKFNERQVLLNQIRQHLHQTLDLDKLIPRIFTEVNKAIRAEAQSIWLVDEEAGAIKCRYASGPNSEALKGFGVPIIGKSIVGTSVSQQKSIIIVDAQNDPRRARSADEWTGFVTRSLMTVPLVLEDKSIGAIQAVNKRGGKLFNQEDLDLFRAIADSAALAVNNAQLVTELQNSYDLTLEALSAALDLRDRETEGHSRRVVEYTTRLAQQIELDEEAIQNIRRGALIHDIGKIGVPDAVLLKPGELNDDERKIIERHPQAGHDMLADIPYLKKEIQIVLAHQEKWNGTGYPFGLQGEEIPLGARLFAIADTFDAITSDRPYRKGQPYEVARKLIEDESGKQFDPQAVAAFIGVPAEEWVSIRNKVMDEIASRHRRQPAEKNLEDKIL